MFKLLLMHHVIFGIRWFSGNKFSTWLCKEPKVSVLQANAQLVQKGECWTLNQRFMRGLGSILTGGNILSLDFFCFVVCLWKKPDCPDSNQIKGVSSCLDFLFQKHFAAQSQSPWIELPELKNTPKMKMIQINCKRKLISQTILCQ